MNIALKFLLPLLIFITGFILIIFQTYLNMNSEYARMIRNTSTQAKIVGNRLASRITYEAKSYGFSEPKMISLTAPYMADTLDQVEVYDQNFELQFSRYIASQENENKNTINKSIAKKVIQDQFSHIVYEEKEKHIIGYFPIDLPVQKGEILSRQTGVIHLVFDVSKEYAQSKDSILYTAATNIVIITVMVSVFSLLLYFLVFKRLSALHKASLKLSDGDFNVYVKSKGEDELTQVIHTFNSMAIDMHSYKNTMEELVGKAINEQHEQNKILIQQSRMASMGEMIGNIAHQWRQPLNALGLLIQKIEIFSKRGKLTQEALEENVQKAVTIINNMSTTIDDFRDFFKPDKNKEVFGLKDVVDDVMVLLDAGLEEYNISVNIYIDQPCCKIYGFKNEFAQVIINLINNSKDALIENQIEDKTIFITGKQDKKEVIFQVKDNAGGIPEAIIDRIFEPYYTTKEEGKGTGIGLYMSKMIVEENMHGNMSVCNNELGAEFSMIFKNSEDRQ